MKTKTRHGSASADTSRIACAPGALPGGLTRTRFFDGMFLSQADLETEQRYWRIKRRLTNRALGDGVVWGLRLVWDPQRRAFALSPGYALDCCGNDLVVECPVHTTEAELWERADPGLRTRVAHYRLGRSKEPAAAAGANRQPAAKLPDQRGLRRACVVLQYVECSEEARPVHRDACDNVTGGCEVSRIRETTRLLLVPPPSPPPPTPPQLFWDELIELRDRLPASIRDALFPPDAEPPAEEEPASGAVPAQLRVEVPTVAGASVAMVAPRVGETFTGPMMPGLQNVGAGRTGVVTFELQPSAGWGFTAGTVLDGDRTVETVTAPPAPSMYWSLDVALPEPETMATTSFEFRVEDLTIQQAFGARAWGRVSLVIRGEVTVEAAGDSEQIEVRLREGWSIEILEASVVEPSDLRSCFSDVVPWGFAVDTADGSRIARVLVLAAAYALLHEVTARAPRYQQVASSLYAVMWQALFGVNPLADVDEQYRRELVDLLVRLYERWCAGLVYPGPRCTDEHHGVYLGCVEIDRSGRIVSFDPWEGRRYVITGPLLEHWAGQFGIAPVDVVVGRFAEALCCLAGEAQLATPQPGHRRFVEGMFGVHVGTVGSINEWSGNLGVPVRWGLGSELASRFVEVFARRDDNKPREILGVSLPDGGSIGIVVPAAGGEVRGGALYDDAIAVLRRGEARVTPRARQPLANLTVELARSAPATSLVRESEGPLLELARRLDARDVTIAVLAEEGADASLARISGASEGDRARADELADRAELAVDAIATTVGRTVGSGFRRERLAQPDTIGALTDALAQPLHGRLERALVEEVVRRVAEP